MLPNYPLRFTPIFKNMLWGGGRLPSYLRTQSPSMDPIGEAWVLSDVDGSISTIANGPLVGQNLRDVLRQYPTEIFGNQCPSDGRFPLLLKFIDAKQELSVQVHPNDQQAVQLRGPGHRGKTEAWVILNADPVTSKIYAGFEPGQSAETFRQALANNDIPQTLHSFTPQVGDCVFLESGTVHAIGANLLLFEVQQTSDITYRLYDWNRVDAKTGQPRQLHIEEGLQCADFAKGPCLPVTPQRQSDRDQLVTCPYFSLSHRMTDLPYETGTGDECRVLVVLAGQAEVAGEVVQAGDVILLPACLGIVTVQPQGDFRSLECELGNE